MKKDVWIEIKGVQWEDGQKDVTELMTRGTYYHKNNHYYIVYQESEATGFEGCQTTLKVEGQDKVSMIRHGAMHATLIVERDRRNVGYYSTIAGDLQIGVQTKQLQVDLNEEGGKLFFSYALDINASHVSDNEVYISVKECTN